MNSLSLSALAMRIFAGLAGGLVGTLSALAVFLLASFLNPSEGVASSFSLVSILAMVFTSTMVSNLLVGTLFSTWEKEKYSRRRTLLSQIFLFTLILFLFSIPFYLFASLSLAPDKLLSTAGMHFLVSALICSLVCEIVSAWKNALTGLLGTIVSGCFLYGIFTVLFYGLRTEPLLLIFFLPISWAFIVLSNFLVEKVHHSLFAYYGTAPLSPEEKKEGPKNL